MNQSAIGKAFEYALAISIADATQGSISESPAAQAAQDYYEAEKNSDDMRKAADEAVMFLLSFDRHLEKTTQIVIQPDSAGKNGDVRDVIAKSGATEIGFSAKNNHDAIKHQRLSRHIDFGKEWAEYPVSSNYWSAVTPVFDQLEKMRKKGLLFKDIQNKDQLIYDPILKAFENEMRRLCKNYGERFIPGMFSYLVGKHDFYKIIRDIRKKHVVVHPYNINGTLGYGQKWIIPKIVEQIRRKPDSLNTTLITFAGGWQISFRLHNARSMVEPSLKFDVKFLSVPIYTTVFHIPLSNLEYDS